MAQNHPVHRRMLFALAGIRIAWGLERSFRGQIIVAVLGLLAVSILGVPPLWWALLVEALVLGIVVELINAAVEALADHLHPSVHSRIGAVKDMTAAAVLLTNLIAVIVVAAFLLRGLGKAF